MDEIAEGTTILNHGKRFKEAYGIQAVQAFAERQEDRAEKNKDTALIL